MIKILDYKGYDIRYDSFRRVFDISGETFPTQADAEKYADKLERAAKSSFQRISAICFRYGYIFTGEVTGIIDSNNAWFRTEDGRRTKERLADLFCATGDNLARLRLYDELGKQISYLIEKRGSIKFDSPIDSSIDSSILLKDE